MTTFISYSRGNSDFAFRLAKDLRQAGFDIWLDQLDIRTGSRWDDEVEKALETSTTFLIILTPESIQSQNVKDEIGYAIDAGKNILPIILKPCNVPFRLRRFQYVDFSDKPYEESFNQIKRLLTNTDELAGQPHKGEDHSPMERSLSRSHGEKTESLQSWKLAIIGILGAIAIALLILIPRVFSGQFGSSTPASVPTPLTAIVIPSATETGSPRPASTDLSSTETLVSTATPLPAEIVDPKGVEMVLIPEGEFNMGSTEGSADEGPVHSVFLNSYYIDKYEVTNALYKACLDAAICQPLKNNSSATRPRYFDNPEFEQYPVLYVDWNMAKTYCEWRGARLPSEAEWEKAARGRNDYLYPWGNVISCNYANFSSCTGDTSQVGVYDIGKSMYGVYDMAGNAWEWVEDWYSQDYYGISPENNPAGPGNGREKTLRGGSWSDSSTEVRSVNRYSQPLSDFNFYFGFRCAKSP